VNKVIANLTHALTNLHFSVPSLLGAAFAIAQIWLPKYATLLNSTAAVLVGYGFIAADNTPSSPPLPASQVTPPTPPATPQPVITKA
jgi:tetrahydromethanopterin S-methyltransferase subunit E